MKRIGLISCLCSMVCIQAVFSQQATPPAPAAGSAMDTSARPLFRILMGSGFFKMNTADKITTYEGFLKQVPDEGMGQLASQYDGLRSDIAHDYAKAGDKNNMLLWLGKTRTPDGIISANITSGDALLSNDDKAEAAFVEQRLRPMVDSVMQAFRRDGSAKGDYVRLMPLYVKALLALQQQARIVYCLEPLYQASGKKVPQDPRLKVFIKPGQYHVTYNLTIDYGVALSETGRSKEGLAVLTNIYLSGDEPSHEFEALIGQACKKTPGGEAYFRHATDSVHQYYKAKLAAFAQNKKDMNGHPVDFDVLKGKYVLVDFWGSWCHPCRASHPHLKELYARYKEKGFEIIGVAQETAKTPEERRKLWTGAVEQDGLPWLQVMNNENSEQFDAVKEYGITAFPTKILLDRDGNIIGRYVGNGPDGSAFSARLEELLGK